MSTQLEAEDGLEDAEDVIGGLASQCELTEDGLTPPTPGSPDTLDCSGKAYELNLYYSKVNIEYGTDRPDLCPFIEFRPYYYKASVDPAFRPEWTSGVINCRDTNNIGCFNGPARSIITNFPTFDSNLMLTFIESARSYTVNSGFSEVPSSNRWITNPPQSMDYLNVADFFRGTAGGGDGYVPGTLQNYQVVCLDEADEELYSITAYFGDYDLANSTDSPNSLSFNDYGDWDSISSIIDPQVCVTPSIPGEACPPCSDVDFPYVGPGVCNVTDCTDIGTPYDGCTAAFCEDVGVGPTGLEGPIPWASCTAELCTDAGQGPGGDPWPGCTYDLCTDILTPYDWCDASQCTGPGTGPATPSQPGGVSWPNCT